MPTISMFYGIITRMYMRQASTRYPIFMCIMPSIVVDIRRCEISEGILPKKQSKLVLAWAELHREELMADWELVMNGEEPFKIQPLQ